MPNKLTSQHIAQTAHLHTQYRQTISPPPAVSKQRSSSDDRRTARRARPSHLGPPLSADLPRPPCPGQTAGQPETAGRVPSSPGCSVSGQRRGVSVTVTPGWRRADVPTAGPAAAAHGPRQLRESAGSGQSGGAEEKPCRDRCSAASRTAYGGGRGVRAPPTGGRRHADGLSDTADVQTTH